MNETRKTTQSILVTGGTGFIGSALCRALLADGHSVTVLSRSPEKVRKRCGDAVQSMGALDDWTPGLVFDAVVNLAGEPIADRAWTDAQKQRIRDSRIALTERLVAAIARARVKPLVLLSGSAIGFYGDTGDRAVDEDAPPADDFAAVLCRDWELATRAAEPLGVRVCLLRTGLVLDPSGGLLRKMLPSFRAGFGARLGDGRQWMSWIALADHLDAMRFLLAAEGARGAFNLTAPAPVTNAAFTQQLAGALGRRAFLVAPATVLRLALGERAPMLLGGQRVLPRRLEALGFPFRFPALDAALQSMALTAR